MNKESKLEIITEVLAIIEKHECTFSEAKTVLLDARMVLESKGVKF